MRITRTSMISGETNTLELPVTEEQLEKYYGGELLQNAFPDLSPGQREFIKTGITEQEWDSMFGGNEDDEQEEDNE